jgi:glutaredoxin
VTRVTLYGKPGCHLCEEAREVLVAVRRERPFELDEIDVSLDAALNRDYGARIPVVSVNGDEAFEYFVNRRALEQRLDRVSS